ncbi:hypothetical protein PCYB_101970, partial [Plasmodium cynomolgi strain B]
MSLNQDDSSSKKEDHVEEKIIQKRKKFRKKKRKRKVKVKQYITRNVLNKNRPFAFFFFKCAHSITFFAIQTNKYLNLFLRNYA